MQTIKKKLAGALLVCTSLLISCRKVSGQSTSLTISPAVVNEDSPQTLTCVYSGVETVNSVSWYANDKLEGVLNVTYGVCSEIFWKHENLHSYSCDVSSKTFRLTILNVKRSNRTDIWRCTISFVGVLERENSNNVTPLVKVSITNVTMRLPESNTSTIQENSTRQFQCVTSGGLPEPTIKWYNDSKTPGNTSDDKEITSLINKSYSNTSDNLIITTSTLTFTASKFDNEIKIYCSAYVSKDQTPLISTRKPKLNVLYGPDSPPKFQGFAAGATYRVIENIPGQLTCYITGGNPLPTLSWTCFDTGTSDNTDADTVSKTARWTAVRGQDRKCTCRSSHPSGNSYGEIQVEILYPPTTPTLFIKSTEVSGTVKVIRNNQVSVECRSSGKPNQIKYTWKHNLATTLNATLTTSNLKNRDQYTCEVENSMNPSFGSVVPGKNSSSLTFEVLYPPSTPSFRYWNISGAAIPNKIINVIQNDDVKVACMSQSRPDPDHYQWDNRGNNQILTVSSITAAKQDHMYKCLVRNAMYETVPISSNPTRGTSSATLTVHVMYPPSKPTFKYQYGQEQQVIFSDTLSVREYNPTSFIVTCESKSEPGPTISWEKQATPSSILRFQNIGRSKAGIYNCTAENLMTRTFKNPEKNVSGRNFNSLKLHILYPPEVGRLQNKSVVEGRPFSYNCSVKVGNPKETLFTWRKSDREVLRLQTLTIQNVYRTDAAFYSCLAENLMKQTGDQTGTKGTDSKSFYLNVWYGANVTDFYVEGFPGEKSVTVNETTENVQFRCIVDSNPGSLMSIQNETKQLNSGSDVKSLDYQLPAASCLDTGIYKCLGNNDYNTNKEQSLRQLKFFVNCSPRNSPLSQLKTNVTSRKNISAVLTFTALAHPVPSKEDFRWFFVQTNGHRLFLLNDEAFRIDTNHLTSNLTILDVNKTLYGTYRLHVKNAFGDFEQIFYLVPEDKPDEPTNFIHKQELVTESSFTVEWKPGSENGPKQTFILKYKKESQQEWTEVIIPDSGEAVMNYTVSDLSSGTSYQVFLYASNRLGNSTETDLLTISTKAIEDEPNNGPLIGGVVGGGVVCVALFVVLGVILMRRFNTVKGNAKSKTDKNDRKRVYEDDENDYGMQDNPMYVSAGPLGEASGGSCEAGPLYSAVDKNRLVPDSSTNDVYAEVNKPKKAKVNNGKNEKPEKGKHGFKSDKKGKKGTQDGDIYENATVADTKTKQKLNDETIYENPETSNSKKNVNKDGLIYADLTFNDQPKGQKKLVIHGLDSMTEYVKVDFTKKADPLPDSDDENVPPK